MSNKLSQHEARREWWIPFYWGGTKDRPVKIHLQELQSLDIPDATHVREVLPGEITLTREELRRALFSAWKECDPGNRWPVASVTARIERALGLRSEGTEG